MKFLITVALSFVGGVWFALENPMIGRNIKSYAELALMYISSAVGG